MKVANSGVPDLWTESVENGYYIVPYYFLDEKGNEHTVTVYLLFHGTHIGFNFLKNQSFLTGLISFPHFWLPWVFFIQFGHLWQFFWTKWDACNFDHLLWLSSRSNLSSLGLSKFIVWTSNYDGANYICYSRFFRHALIFPKFRFSSEILSILVELKRS